MAEQLPIKKVCFCIKEFSGHIWDIWPQSDEVTEEYVKDFCFRMGFTYSVVSRSYFRKWDKSFSMVSKEERKFNGTRRYIKHVVVENISDDEYLGNSSYPLRMGHHGESMVI